MDPDAVTAVVVAVAVTRRIDVDDDVLTIVTVPMDRYVS